ncbi:hypothetical protein IMG5_136330 [Ichthyophthirius multifiliis]|uniref:Uncharacterized protein n=1 Tax=Ichthyophthirius multifiliis TaxID=5932 RepID=G0QWY0_ICHMU|nr:hypothetical protein IMG5_136330 [Ichthyophthirius multifiliis]EGR30273.1 hypothetical protein IMG5_136330 [Ichthyophthirius multifiliis]|eukprot:XP_004031860.1 hypothetical protein IMG5_136330 [Ichthyophthirius multifiliis]
MNYQQNQSQQYYNNTLQNRLELIESNLARVCNQHEALMPLLSLLEIVPRINNSENNLKQITQRNKKDISNLLSDFKNQIQQSVKKQEEKQLHSKNNAHESKQQHELQEKVFLNKKTKKINFVFLYIYIYIYKQVNHYMDKVQIQYQKDMTNLYREIGMIRNEIELAYDKERRSNIFEQINQFPKDLDQNDKKLSIANLEQNVFFSDIEYFDKENQERLIYELDCLKYKVQFFIQIKQTKYKKRLNKQAILL